MTGRLPAATNSHVPPCYDSCRRAGSSATAKDGVSMATEPQLRRLQRVEVDGLFGIYNHRFDLDLVERVTLLHGPNGVGKTTILKMVDALLTERFGYFRTIPFRRLLLGFEDGAELEVKKENTEENSDVGTACLMANGSIVRLGPIRFTASRAEAIATQIEYLEPAGDSAWVDIRDGEWLTETEVVKRVGPRYLREPSPITGATAARDVQWLRDFLGAAESHFIEAQRLVRPRYIVGWNRRPEAPNSRVVECSRDLRRRIDLTMADYGRQAQSLDQSFPQRLLQRDASRGNLPVEEIRERMSTLDQRTGELKKIGILDETPTHPFQVVDDIDKSQAGVMSLYVQDTEDKLKVLDDLADRVRLLLESLNGKFRHKQVRVDREAGLAVANDDSDTLPLDSLSSGEQHELILHYDLLFRVPSNTVVLLDEPELSLHIEWQSKFLADLMAIVKLSHFDALLATHSPYIVGERDDLMVELSG